jgi:tetratricopeptide (TPR) repeat protein
VGRHQILTPGNRTFVAKDVLALGFQVDTQNPALLSEGKIRFVLTRGDELVKSLTRSIGEYPDFPVVLERWPLSDLPPGHYTIRAALRTRDEEILAQSEEFDITTWESLPRPGIHTKSLPPTRDALYDYVLGVQLFKQKKLEQAEDRFANAVRKKPANVSYALYLARARLAREEYAAAEAALRPFTGGDPAGNEDALHLLGTALHKQGKYEQAAAAYQKVLMARGLSTPLLNDLGECYARLGLIEEALRNYEKSLEIQPDQPDIRAKVAELKK